MKRSTLLAATAAACGAGLLGAQEAAAPIRPQPPQKGERLVGQVVSTDAAGRALTVRRVRRPGEAADEGTAARAAGAETLRLTVSESAAGQLGRYEPGDWVELTCGTAVPLAATADAPAAQATPPPAPTGTGAPPGTGTTGVGTTGTGISGTGTPPPGTTPAGSEAASAATLEGADREGGARTGLLAWVRENCRMVTAVGRSTVSPDAQR
jgi:hypothetical protein